jgi:hypothetical protein
MQELIRAIDMATKPAWKQIISEARHELGVQELTYVDLLAYIQRHGQYDDLGAASPGQFNRFLDRIFRDIGFDLSQWPIARRRSTRGAFHMALEPGQSSAVYLPPSGSLRSLVVTAHEYGHALSSLSTRQEYTILNDFDDYFNEATAMFFEFLCFDPQWMQAHNVVAESERQAVYEARFVELLFNLRCVLSELSANITVYADPEMDIAWTQDQFGDIYLDVKGFSQRPDFGSSVLMEDFQGVHYLTGSILATQLLDWARAKEGGVVHNPRLAQWLVDRWFQWGSLLEPQYLIRSLTNEGPRIGHLLFELNRLSFMGGRGNMEFGDHAAFQEAQRLTTSAIDTSI